MMLKVEKICREIGKYLLRYRASIISNYTELSMKTFYDDKNENGYQESIKVNLGERRSTINSVTPKIAGEVCNILLKIEDFEFNIFELDKLIGKDTMLYMSNEIFQNLYFFEDVIDEMKFRKFICKVIEGYDRNVSYHNDLHAADVLQTLYVMMEKGSIYYKISLIEIDYMAVLLSAICHDLKHPGIGNPYIINSKHEIAMIYNGKKFLI